MNIKTDKCNGYTIRFVEKEPGEWWAIAKDAAKALGYWHTRLMLRKLESEDIDFVQLADKKGKLRKTLVISEIGCYAAMFGSRTPDGKQFKRWTNALAAKQLDDNVSDREE